MKKDRKAVKEILKSGVDVNSEEKFSFYSTPLMKAIRNNDVKTARLLIDMGADVNAKDTSVFREPVFSKIEKDNTEMADLLKNSGADLEAENALKAKMTDSFASKPGVKILKMILEAGIDIDSRDMYGNTSLMVRAACGDTEGLKKLIELGAGINCSSDNGMTPVMHAVRNGHYNTAAFLLKTGADIKIKDRSGKIAADYASNRIIRTLFVQEQA
ncbi:MAG: ankyrin repeat domain-containing protein [bacterium]